MFAPELPIAPASSPMDARVRPPGSKSITNRALLVAALADGTSTLEHALRSDDTEVMTEALKRLGIAVEAEGDRFVVQGGGGRLAPGPIAIELGNAGTAARFLPPALALGSGTYLLDGSPRMRERPVAPLAAALRTLGVRVDGDAFPLRVEGRGGALGGSVAVDGSASSQYASGLMLSAPCYDRGLTVELTGTVVSRPYLELTAGVMEAFGAGVERDGNNVFTVPHSSYRARRYEIEPDATAASYFFAAAAITGGRVVVEGLGAGSLQGDLAFVHVLERMGCGVRMADDTTEVVGPSRLTGVDVDLRDISDTAQTLAAVAVFADRPTRIRGIGFIRRKESDRIGAVAGELRRAGIEAVEHDDGLTIQPGTPQPARIETHDDHRMAMSFALLGLRAPGIVIADPACVTKTYPDYFEALSSAVRSDST